MNPPAHTNDPNALPTEPRPGPFQPRVEAAARTHLQAAFASFQRRPRQWLDEGAHFAVYAYETLVNGQPREQETGRPPTTPDFADQQQPAATAAVKAFAREISPDPAWLEQLELLLPDRKPRRPFGWHAIQTLPRPAA